MASMRRILQTQSVFLLLNFISASQMSPLSPYLVNSFPSAPKATLNHFTVSENGSVYIGAVDNLYHLSQNFSVKSQVEFRSGGECNVNKILDIIPFPVDNLISCGTGLTGTCQLRNLDNISQEVRNLSHRTLTVAPDDDSTVGLVVEEARERISLHVAQTVRTNDDLPSRRTVAVICLHRDQNECRNMHDRKTKNLADVLHDFIIHYVAVFSYKGYTYYVSSQRKDATKDTSDKSPIVPKMSRVCHNDTSEDLSGFTEITLECKGKNGTLYSIAKSALEVNGTLYIAFVKNIPEEGSNFQGTNESALCMFEMENLKTDFEDSIVNCSCNARFRSHNNYLSGGTCPADTIRANGIILLICGCENGDCLGLNTAGWNQVPDCQLVEAFTCYPHKDVGSRYPERSPSLAAIRGSPVFEWSGASFSSVLVTEIDQPIRKHVAFIGTSEGTLLKVHFDAGLTANSVFYEALEMGYSVLSDPRISPRGDTALFLTEKQLLEITLANCSQYQTCKECIQPGSEEGDPHCGWCTLEKSCTIYKKCKSSSIPSRWLWYNENNCSAITDVTPSSLSTDVHSQMVNVTVTQLPVPGNFSYMCHFGPNFTSAATLHNGMLSCPSPGNTDIPRIPDGDDAVEVNFTISSTALNISFVSTPYTFFNCSRIRRCRDCVSKWTCDWCIDELRCMYNRNSTCHNITSLRDGAADSCPLLVPGKDVVPSGVYREIHITARNLNLTSGLLEKGYECVIEAEKTTQMTFISNASIIEVSNDEYNMTCNNTQYSYSLEEQEIPAFLTLRWKNTDVFLDGAFNVTLYKCHIDRPDCSRCHSNITARPELECGWCNAPQGFCAVKENCSSNFSHECSDPPQISSVTPTSSPIEGGTIVEIHGTDLGQRFSDIINVTLAGVVCDHQCCEKQYQVGASLTCLTGNSSTEGQGTISVLVTNGEAEYERDDFSYNNPQISSFHPMVGPKSGGTLITINGAHLLTGRGISVEVGEQMCTISEHSPTTIVCENEGLAPHNTSTANQTVSVKFDGNERLATGKFVYHEDPTVTEIIPPRAIVSGGNLLTVTGERLHLIQKPKIQFSVDGHSAEEDCFSQSENEMEIMCKSPSIISILQKRRRRADSPGEGIVAVGFIMDGVTELLHWSQNNSVVFQYFKDPQYETFDDPRKATDNILTLSGTDLNAASSIRDVTVYVGATDLCQVKSLDTNTLFCELPLQQPEPGDLYGNRKSNKLPFVIVRHANLEVDIGYISYTEFDVIWFIVSAFGAFLIVIVIVLFVSACCIRKRKTKKIRDLELQVRNIHESVSANLKTLFATLQTTMHDFETDIVEQTRIPLLDKRHYLLNMMFLGLEVEPSSSPPQENVGNSNIRAAMEEFSNFLYYKSFLKVLITTMDNTTNISVKERANAGSLLSICLLQNGKLELYTDVLLSLMQEQIEECDSKGKQRILFSRNDTMLEKLISNWLVIFLCGFLKEQAALQFYQLYEAVKYVCEMGPIDAVSGKSQFTINDQQMLETQIDFDEVRLDVITNSVSGEKKSINVPDVNTVTQVKERIISHNYRHFPYSQRPSPFALDLMWRAGRSGQLILRDDDDLPGTLEKEWKKISTLKDLKVPSDSIFELVNKQENPNAEVYLDGNEGQTETEGYSRQICPDFENNQQETVSASSIYETVQSKGRTYDVKVKEGVRVWHLIKEDLEDFPEENDKKERRPHKDIKEVVLPFLPATRNYIQKYVDRLINAILAADDEADVPLSIKYLFQFFDREAQREGKPELAKAWKNNVLPLRYWSTILANPQYVLDVGVYTYTHASLRILVQVIRDTCVGRVKVYKDKDFSPSRLLFSNVLPGYISKLDNYHLFISNLGRVDPKDLRQECKNVEQEFQDIFDLTSTQQKLFSFVTDHQTELIKALEENGVTSELSLATELQKVADMIRKK